MSIEAMRQALEALEEATTYTNSESWSFSMTRYCKAAITVLRAAIEQAEKPVEIDGNTSDGYHTFNELYEFRKAYNAALFNEWAAGGKCSVHKSWRHHNGELCFGGGWFIVVAVLPQGQISNHYEAKDWNLFDVPETERALFEFDGHTGSDVVARLKAYTASPTAPRQEHYDQTSLELCEECGWKAIIPGDGCLVCARQKAKPVAYTYTGIRQDGSEHGPHLIWKPEHRDAMSASKGAVAIPLYTAPRQWVGLTNKDIIEMWPETSTVGWDDIRLIEAKLKEKNAA